MLIMILFQWVQIDWIKWMPVEIAVLLGLIIIIRIMRRLTRWGPVRISHVTEGLWDYSGKSFRIYKKSNPFEPEYQEKHKSIEKTENNEIDSKEKKKNGKILLIPPVPPTPNAKRFEKGNHVATAIAMLGHDVIILNPKNLQNFFMKHDNGHESKSGLDFGRFLVDGDFSMVVLFDWAIYPVFKQLGFFGEHEVEKKLLDISWILIRPTLKWSDIKPIQKIIPFTDIWIYILQFLGVRSKFFRNDADDGESGSKSELKTELKTELFNNNVKFKKMVFIEPSRTWLSPTGIKNLQIFQEKYINNPNEDIFQFKKGNWTFFRNETIVLGIIIQKIIEMDKKGDSEFI